MASVPYKGAPTVEPSAGVPAAGPPDDYNRPNVNANQFGGYIAEGVKQLGQGLTQAGEQWGQVQLDSQVTKAMKDVDEQTDNFSKLQGQEALEQQGAAKQSIDQAVGNYGSQLAPYLKAKYDAAMRQYQYRYSYGKINTHADEQGRSVAAKTNTDTVVQATTLAATNYNDPETVKHSIADAIHGYQQQVIAEGNGSNPQEMARAEMKGKEDVYTAVAESMYAHNAPNGYAFVQKYQKELGLHAAPLLDKFKSRADTENDRGTSEVTRNIFRTFQTNPVAARGILDANKASMAPEDFDRLDQLIGHPGQAATGQSSATPTSNVVPIRPGAAVKPGEVPSDTAARLLTEEKQKQPGQPAAPDALGRVGGQGARIEVPFAPSMMTAAGRADLLDHGLKTYQPGTQFVVAGREFTVPPAGTSFQYEGKSYTVPGVKAQTAPAPAASQPAAATAPVAQPQPTAPAPTPAAGVPQTSSQNFSPANAPKTGQALPFGEEQTKNYSPAQTAIARLIDSRSDKNLDVRQIPGNTLEQARDVALHSGPGGLQQFMAAQGYPKSGNWCGEFAAAVVKGSGGTPPKNPQIASNWRNWGQLTAEPKSGDIAVRRGAPTGQTGSHVTFVENYSPAKGTFTAIGGNQGHMRSTFRIADYEFRSGGSQQQASQ